MVRSALLLVIPSVLELEHRLGQQVLGHQLEEQASEHPLAQESAHQLAIAWELQLAIALEPVWAIGWVPWLVHS